MLLYLLLACALWDLFLFLEVDDNRNFQMFKFFAYNVVLSISREIFQSKRKKKTNVVYDYFFIVSVYIFVVVNGFRQPHDDIFWENVERELAIEC